jgi:hypothetical protein
MGPFGSDVILPDAPCQAGVCTGLKCFCPVGLVRQIFKWGEECVTPGEATESLVPDNTFFGLYGIDLGGRVYFVPYTEDSKPIGEPIDISENLPFNMGSARSVRYDFYDNSLVFNDAYQGKF